MGLVDLAPPTTTPSPLIPLPTTRAPTHLTAVAVLVRSTHQRCIDLYDKAGIDLAAEPIVAVGSVCRRQSTIEAAEIITAITDAVPKIRLHGYGIKTDGLGRYGSLLSSSDSMAWSQGARIRRILLPGCTGHKTCNNCIRWAFQWRQRVLASLAGHATRTAAPRRTAVSRKPDAIARAAQRLALCRFQDAVAVLERDLNIRHAHRDGMTIRAIATFMDVSPALIKQIIAADVDPLLDQLRALRQRWGVDNDPATRAAADHIIADLVAAGTARTQPAQKEVVGPRRSGDATDPTLFEII
ncbi:DUF7221 family queuine tRNA-ribosyltransferase-like protein [Nocardia abscessus]|uniref:deazapurine DNA modification protein DpdA family protein n=1 Tax=Nocardia abscessus TaxID=120957 RepID=UPI002456307F|nr:hypothetical protein [Nocardia abscessus]